jgi:hypothetical protein
MFAEFTHPARPIHPGMVSFVGPDGVERAERADHLPEWLAYAPDADGRAVPVVRVVRLNTDRGIAMRSYAADGRLLWVGMTVTAAPTDFATTPRPTAVRATAADHAPVGWF